MELPLALYHNIVKRIHVEQWKTRHDYCWLQASDSAQGWEDSRNSTDSYRLMHVVLYKKHRISGWYVQIKHGQAYTGNVTATAGSVQLSWAECVMGELKREYSGSKKLHKCFHLQLARSLLTSCAKKSQMWDDDTDIHDVNYGTPLRY